MKYQAPAIGEGRGDGRLGAAADRLARLAAMADREADRVARLIAAERPISLKGKQKGKTKAKNRARPAMIAAPTPEQAAKADYDMQPVRTEHGQVLGRAWRRQPWFESLAKREAGEAAREGRTALIGPDGLNALRFYRHAHEAASRSEMRCALDILPGGRAPGGGGGDLPPAMLVARANLALCEAGLGELRATLRAVALDDLTYAAVAMERFGARDQDWYDPATGAFVAKPVPRSNRHPGIIRAEFLAGVEALVAAVRGRVRTG